MSELENKNEVANEVAKEQEDEIQKKDLEKEQKEQEDEIQKEVDKQVAKQLKDTRSQYPKDLEEELANNDKWEKVDHKKDKINKENITSKESLRQALKKHHSIKKYFFFYIDPDGVKHKFLVHQPKLKDTKKVVDSYGVINYYRSKEDKTSEDYKAAEQSSINITIEMMYKYLLDPVEEKRIFESEEEAIEMIENGSYSLNGLLTQFTIFIGNVITGHISEVKKKNSL